MCRHQVTVYSERLDRDSNLYVTIKPKMKVTEYIREDGSSPYEKWFNSLDVYFQIFCPYHLSTKQRGFVHGIENRHLQESITQLQPWKQAD